MRPRLPVDAMKGPSVQIVANFVDKGPACGPHHRVIGESQCFESLCEAEGAQQQDGSDGGEQQPHFRLQDKKCHQCDVQTETEAASIKG